MFNVQSNNQLEVSFVYCTNQTKRLKGYFTHFKQISKLSNIDKLIFIKHNPKFSQSCHVVFLLFTLTI